MSWTLIRLRWLALLFVFAMSMADAAELQRNIKVGILPYLSPQVLITLFAPVREQLQQQTGIPVELYTATDVPGILKKSLHQDYDVLIMSAHLSRLLQKRAGYIPAIQFTNDLYGSVFVADNSNMLKLADLRGKKLAVTDRAVLVNLAVFKALQEDHIREGDLIVRPSLNQNAALLSIVKGENDAAIAAHFALDQMPEEQARCCREIFRTQALPNMMISFSSRLSEKQRLALTSALLNLPETEAGAQFLKNSRFGGVKKIELSSMPELDKFLPKTLKYLDLQ
ncbi:phosphate/phosphite/phosphonate ABC transporter substrate-binding protein [Undibacterium sp. Dicai25W]|uniref:phosphate/phosphite/phosphonate ABC transporter substrate-binding protein n=1 Tax=Undibacterium sp. Dicai25W TaxID=3413034 RepID=UPI003BF3D4ED